MSEVETGESPPVIKLSSEIKRFFASKPSGALVTISEIWQGCAASHSRNAVGIALFRLTRRGYLTRVANGLYTLRSQQKPHYTEAEIVKRKSDDTVSIVAVNPTTYLSLGKVTRFKYDDQQITIKCSDPRKVKLAASEIGFTVLKLWERGKDNTQVEDIAMIMAAWSRDDLVEFIALENCMPIWLASRAKKAIGSLWRRPFSGQKSTVPVVIDNSDICRS